MSYHQYWSTLDSCLKICEVRIVLKANPIVKIDKYLCSQVTKTDDGLEAIVFTAQGDMRQVRK